MNIVKLGLIIFWLLRAAPALANEVKLDIDESEWSKEQIALINQAASIVVKRMPSTEVARCAFRHAWRGEPSESNWAKDMATFRRGKELELKIIKGTTRASALGQAKIGIGIPADQRQGFKNLTIRLNESHVNYRYLDKRMGRHPDELRQMYLKQEFWAEVIAHEIGHNLGLRHGTDGDWDKSYKGYFISEVGACVMHNGRRGTYKN